MAQSLIDFDVEEERKKLNVVQKPTSTSTSPKKEDGDKEKKDAKDTEKARKASTLKDRVVAQLVGMVIMTVIGMVVACLIGFPSFISSSLSKQEEISAKVQEIQSHDTTQYVRLPNGEIVTYAEYVKWLQNQ